LFAGLQAEFPSGFAKRSGGGSALSVLGGTKGFQVIIVLKFFTNSNEFLEGEDGERPEDYAPRSRRIIQVEPSRSAVGRVMGSKRAIRGPAPQ
jgi:hypothetical protein